MSRNCKIRQSGWLDAVHGRADDVAWRMSRIRRTLGYTVAVMLAAASLAEATKGHGLGATVLAHPIFWAKVLAVGIALATFASLKVRAEGVNVLFSDLRGRVTFRAPEVPTAFTRLTRFALFLAGAATVCAEEVGLASYRARGLPVPEGTSFLLATALCGYAALGVAAAAGFRVRVWWTQVALTVLAAGATFSVPPWPHRAGYPAYYAQPGLIALFFLILFLMAYAIVRIVQTRVGSNGRDRSDQRRAPAPA